jgi:DNA-directed RNA polymerase specialized sigma24 family protein
MQGEGCPATCKEFQDYLATMLVLPSEAEDLWQKCEQRGWKDGGNVPITNWKAYCNRMAKYIIQDRSKRGAQEEPREKINPVNVR